MSKVLEYTIEPYYYSIKVRGPFSKRLYDRLMAFPATRFNRHERSWVIPKAYQHLAEIVIVSFLNHRSKLEWILKYKEDTNQPFLRPVDARAVIKENFMLTDDAGFLDYLIDRLPEGSKWREVLIKNEVERRFLLEEQENEEK